MHVRCVALVPLALLAGCGTGAEQVGGSSSCAASVRWHGRSYHGTHVPGRPLRPGRRLGRGVLPGCNDTGVTDVNGKLSEPDPAGVAVVRRIRGVAPSHAVMLSGDRRTAYVTPACSRDIRCRAAIRASASP